MSKGILFYVVGIAILSLVLANDYNQQSRILNVFHDTNTTLQKSLITTSGYNRGISERILKLKGKNKYFTQVLIPSLDSIDCLANDFYYFLDKEISCVKSKMYCSNLSVKSVDLKLKSLRKELIGIYSTTLYCETVVIMGQLTEKEMENKIQKIKSITEISNVHQGGSLEKGLFSNMSEEVALGILNKYRLEARILTNILSREISFLVVGNGIICTGFFPALFPRMDNVVKGERFESRIGIVGESIREEKLSLSINNQSSFLEDSYSRFTEITHNLGKHHVVMEASMLDPDKEELKFGSDTFQYEVGHPSASIFLPQNHYFYIGVDNAFQISVTGIPNEKIKLISLSKSCVISGKNGDYIAQVSEEGNVRIKVETLGESRTYNVSVIKAPDPFASLGENKGGEITRAELVRYHSLEAVIEGFDFDYSCAITGFDCVRMRNGVEPVLVGNKGEAFSDPLKELINQALSEDVYYFKNIRAVCSGDEGERVIRSLVFEVE